jgi:hypothetical protein
MVPLTMVSGGRLGVFLLLQADAKNSMAVAAINSPFLFTNAEIALSFIR